MYLLRGVCCVYHDNFHRRFSFDDNTLMIALSNFCGRPIQLKLPNFIIVLFGEKFEGRILSFQIG